MDKSAHLHPAVEKHAVTAELLEDAGNCRQSINQEQRLLRLSDSLFSEQQKLRHVLDWAESFLHSRSEVCSEMCRADRLILAAAERTPPGCADKHHQPVCCAAGLPQGFGGLSNSYPCRHKPALSVSESRDCGNRNCLYPQRTTSKQTQSRGDGGANRLHVSRQAHHASDATASRSDAGHRSSESGPVRTPNLPHESTGFLMIRQGSKVAHQEESDQSRRGDSCTLKESRSNTTPSFSPHLTPPPGVTELTASRHVTTGRSKWSEDICPITNTGPDRHLNTAAETTERRSLVLRKKQRSPAPNLDLSEQTVNTPDVSPAEQSDPVRCSLARRGHQRSAGGRKKTADAQRASAGALPRIDRTKNVASQPHREETDESVTPHTHTSLRPAQGHTLRPDGLRPTAAADGRAVHVNRGFKSRPAEGPVGERWLCLPDEVWLSILSLVPHSDLSRVLQVCHRLHTLAADHTLWKDVRIENCCVTDRWLLSVGRRRPRSLCLHSCSSQAVTSGGLEMLLFLCRNSLEEVKVTGCTGPGLHGDQMLSLIGQLCNCVTSVDVSWSGATDRGVKSLSDCGTRLKLKSVVMNGCHISDVPLKELVIKHKESLCRLEVFGCQFLSPSCLQKIYQTCPRLQHLNIGRLPKVNTRCLTVMTSQLKSLVSLTLTGLQAVDDSSAESLLQNCVRLQNLTFRSCPGVTDLTLHNISKYTPHIRSLDVSGCQAVSDAGVQSVALGCLQLQQLDLSSTGTGNRGVSLLADYCSEHLQTVKLSFCHVTAEKILKLCRRCKRLKVLHVFGCPHRPTEAEISAASSTVTVYPLT